MNKLPLQKVARSRRDSIFIVAGTCSPSSSMGTCCPHVACGDNVGAARPRRPTGVKSQESRFKNASGASATQKRSEARLAWPQRIEGKQDVEAASSSSSTLRPSTLFTRGFSKSTTRVSCLLRKRRYLWHRKTWSKTPKPRVRIGYFIFFCFSCS
jgi:hypothetical protein